jgi:hypothetical protein
MRIPRRRAGTALLAVGLALLVAGLALAAVEEGLLHDGSSPQSRGSGTVVLRPVVSSSGVSASSDDRSSNEPGSAASGRARASKGAVVVPYVNLTGAAALPSAHVQPGYDTPEDAVDGFYRALLGGTPTQACAYTTEPCPSFGSDRITGNVSIVDAISDGDEALVEVSGTICRSVNCVPLVDRVIMPAGPTSFGASWTSLTSGIYGWAGSPLPCVRDPGTGHWLVKLV